MSDTCRHGHARTLAVFDMHDGDSEKIRARISTPKQPQEQKEELHHEGNR